MAKKDDAVDLTNGSSGAKAGSNSDVAAMLKELQEIDQKQTDQKTSVPLETTKSSPLPPRTNPRPAPKLTGSQSDSDRLSLTNNQWLALCGIFLVILIGVGYKLNLATLSVKLSEPAVAANLSAEELQFNWHCNRSDVQFVLEIYDGENLLIRQAVSGESFKPDEKQQQVFQAEHDYSWVLRTNPSLSPKYNWTSKPESFHITKAVAAPVKIAPQNPPTPAPLPETTTTPTPRKPGDPLPPNPVKPSLAERYPFH